MIPAQTDFENRQAASSRRGLSLRRFETSSSALAGIGLPIAAGYLLLHAAFDALFMAVGGAPRPAVSGLQPLCPSLVRAGKNGKKNWRSAQRVSTVMWFYLAHSRGIGHPTEEETLDE